MFVCGFVVSVLRCTLTSAYRSGDKGTKRSYTWASPIGRRGLAFPCQTSPVKHPERRLIWISIGDWYFRTEKYLLSHTSSCSTCDLLILSPPLLPKWINPLQTDCVLKTEPAEAPWSPVNVLWQQVPFQNPETGERWKQGTRCEDDEEKGF